MKFFVDMPLSPELAQWLRAEGHDGVHANDLSMHQSPDSEILHFAAGNVRVIITADLDFPRLPAALGSAGPGLILLCAAATTARRRVWPVSAASSFRLRRMNCPSP